MQPGSGARSPSPVGAPDPLGLVSLPPLMRRTRGLPDLRVGLIDGVVLADHPGFSEARVEVQPEGQGGGDASDHATAVAGVLVADRESGAPGICPGATLLVHPIYDAAGPGRGTAAPDELAAAIVGLAESGAAVINMSLVLDQRRGAARVVREALDYASSRGVVLVAAAGNRASVGGSTITGHRSVIPVAAYDLAGNLAPYSNLGHSIGRRGVGAVAEGLVSLGADGGLRPIGGTSAAAAVVAGAVVLLWSEFPRAAPAEVVLAVNRSAPCRPSVVPPLLDAWAAHEVLRTVR
ncbi:S8 family serine peptidase [Saccharopolyspora sp. NFXS83]|uniref:S8 family peptidase n=1 Tax=Saccharopolyspora sp. NFXS83 TaxID=2993560 RepID=UPI00224B813A|nr:S8 family serine peptidase [Saccharopolyspora sp. NFXS83]MCX2729233.1 S8 family serine peptidase [Saccharopolyspora sp. NFXS83]